MQVFVAFVWTAEDTPINWGLFSSAVGAKYMFTLSEYEVHIKKFNAWRDKPDNTIQGVIVYKAMLPESPLGYGEISVTYEWKRERKPAKVLNERVV